MKKVLLSVVLGAVILTSGAVMASSGFSGNQEAVASQLNLSPEQRQKLKHLKLEKMAKRLDLTASQKEKLAVIMADAEKDRNNILKKYGLDEKKLMAMRAEIKESRKGMHKELGKLLTDEQKARMKGARSWHGSQG